MTRVEIEIHEDVITVINKIRNINDSGIELEIPDGAVLFENILNLKLLKRVFEKEGKNIHFKTLDETGQSLIDMLDDTGLSGYPAGGIGDFGFGEEDVALEKTPLVGKIKRCLSNISLPKVPGFKIKKVSVLLLLLIVIFSGIGLYFVSKAPKAHVRVVLTSQPLARSFTLKVVKDGVSDPEEKILKGVEVLSVVTETMEKDTTGEKIVGEKAEGEIKIFNKTGNSIELSEGMQVAYKGVSSDLFYALKDDLTVPALSPQDPTDPASPLIPGEAAVDVIAVEFGEDYNIDDGETLEFEDYKKSELEGKTEGDVSGGKSEVVKTVTAEDKTTLSTNLFEEVSKKVDDTLKAQVDSNEKFIEGSSFAAIQTEEFDNDVDAEVDKLKLTQTISMVGLAYDKEDLNDYLDDLMKEIVPEGFERSDRKKKVNVEVLGNTDSTVLSPQEADLQVTVKTYVVPLVDTKNLSQKLLGKSVGEAEKVLGSISNIKTYELNISPGIPFFQKVPNDLSRVSVEVVCE